MKKYLTLCCLFLTMLFLSSCAVAGGIFKAGVWVGVLAVVAVIVVIILIIRSFSNKS